MYYKRLSRLSEVRTIEILLYIFLFKKSFSYYISTKLYFYLPSLVLCINYKFFYIFIIVGTFYCIKEKIINRD